MCYGESNHNQTQESEIKYRIQDKQLNKLLSTCISLREKSVKLYKNTDSLHRLPI